MTRPRRSAYERIAVGALGCAPSWFIVIECTTLMVTKVNLAPWFKVKGDYPGERTFAGRSVPCPTEKFGARSQR
jgi:hypothetical protein